MLIYAQRIHNPRTKKTVLAFKYITLPLNHQNNLAWELGGKTLE